MKKIKKKKNPHRHDVGKRISYIITIFETITNRKRHVCNEFVDIAFFLQFLPRR